VNKIHDLAMTYYSIKFCSSRSSSLCMEFGVLQKCGLCGPFGCGVTPRNQLQAIFVHPVKFDSSKPNKFGV